MVGADVFDGLQIGLMRDVTVGGQSCQCNLLHSFPFHLSICHILVVELNFPTGKS